MTDSGVRIYFIQILITNCINIVVMHTPTISNPDWYPLWCLLLLQDLLKDSLGFTYSMKCPKSRVTGPVTMWMCTMKGNTKYLCPATVTYRNMTYSPGAYSV